MTPSTSIPFHQQFERHGTWRLEVALRLNALSQWLERNELMDEAIGERLRRLVAQMRSDQVVVAFVAELSRGKSELINALFFAGYGQRIVPAGVGRTTMCPTELGWEHGVPPCLRLLPIETRRDTRALREWRTRPEAWHQFEFDVDNAAQLAAVIDKVTEVRHVSVAEAEALGFWSAHGAADNPPADAHGLIEVPRWRHALINIAHPLLRQGLVILDTPGLNAIGAEPELTVSMIPHAHAVLFILAADAGVTKSDLAVWRDYLAVEPEHAHARLAVLNKIDALWDALSSQPQIDARIGRQLQSVAETLGLPASQVLPVSAQKGLVAKINGDAELLAASCLPQLESALGDGILGQRRQVLRSVVAAGLSGLRQDAQRVLDVRRRELAGQMQELRGLRGKNASVIGAMFTRVQAEQRDFTAAELDTAGVYSAHAKRMRALGAELEASVVHGELQQLSDALGKSGLKLGAASVYAQTFARLRTALERTREQAAQAQGALAASMQRLNAEHGLALAAPAVPELVRCLDRLALIERSHVRHVGLANTLRLARTEFSEQLLRALSLQLQDLFESARADLDLWSRGSLLQIEAQLRERRQGLERRVEAIDRVREAAGSLDERIAEIRLGLGALEQLDSRLAELSSYVVRPTEAAPTNFVDTQRLPF